MFKGGLSVRGMLWVVMLLLLCAGTVSAQTVEVLLILPDRYGVNYFLNRDYFQHFGWNITLTAVTDTVSPCPWGTTVYPLHDLAVDVVIDSIEDVTQYDAVLISSAYRHSGNPYGDLLNNPAALQLLVDANSSGLVVGATCSGVRVLAAADILDGVHITGRAQYEQEYLDAGAIFLGESLPPVIDGTIVTTTKGMWYCINNCEAAADAIEATQTLRNERGSQ
ncbi:hypothetical protein GF324_05860 [bacterium]|nr:hypothetical protein [bacterium]